MTWTSLESVADKQLLHLTTVGRRTGVPREIEIWFVVWCERLYLFAETREAAAWVKNIRPNPKVKVRIGEWRTGATARVLDPHTDRKLWDQVAAIRQSQIWMGRRAAGGNNPAPLRRPIPTQHRTRRRSLSGIVDTIGRSLRTAIKRSRGPNPSPPQPEYAVGCVEWHLQQEQARAER